MATDDTGRVLLVRAVEPTSKRYDAIVIGSGMSGLSSAAILAKEGKRVVVLEQHYRPGGYLHRFYRKGGLAFDVGFHYLGGIERHQVLGKYLQYLGVRDRVRLLPLDPEGYDDIHFPEQRFVIPAGEGRYRERLLEAFPRERPAIERYFRDLKHITEGFGFYQIRVSEELHHVDRWMSMPLQDYLAALTQDVRLRAVLTAQNPLYGVEPRRTPVGLHALVTDSFMQNPYAIDGGGDALAQIMVARVRELGGEVRLKTRVSEILVDDERAVRGVRTARGAELLASTVVSCAHPKVTVGLLPEGVLRPGYRRRVLEMEDGPGTLSLFVTTRADLSHYGGRNIYNYKTSDINAIYDNVEGKPQFVFVTVPTAREGIGKSGLHHVIGLALLGWKHVRAWEDTASGKRGEAYEAFKQQQAEELLGLVTEVVPELAGNIERIEAATPLTNRDFAGSVGGAAYGIHHSVEQSGRYGLRPRTRVGGLFLTGQSVLMPGVCGVTISAFHTCSQILGDEYLMRRVHEACDD